jgi:hypothetical protein
MAARNSHGSSTICRSDCGRNVSGDTSDPANGRPSGVEPHRHQVESIGRVAQQLGGNAHPTSLGARHLIGRVIDDPRLDLDRGDETVDGDEQVDLSMPRAQVAGNEPPPAALEEPEGYGLAEGA